MKQRQHSDGGKGEGREGRISSQGALWAGSSLQVVKCRESPQPHSSPETKAGEVVKSGSLVCRSWCPSTTQASPQHPSASVSAP